MNGNFNTHLSDQQFSEYALGMEPAASTAAHLAQCTACTEELARFSAAMTEFSAAALSWSEAQSPVSLRQLALKPSPRPRFAIASWALAAGFLCAAGVSMVAHRDHRGAADVTSAAAVASVSEDADCSETEIAQDNKLMQDVNMAIGDGEPSPFTQYGLRRTAAVRSRAHVGSRSQ